MPLCPRAQGIFDPVKTAVDRLSAALEDRYSIERELGAGGMATVYLARDKKHDRDVALKVLRPDVASEVGAERFVLEIKLAARLTHPHILPVHDSGEADGFLYYVMPAIEGQSVRDRLARERQLPVEEAIQIAREVADALDYAHKHDVVHRDIKPENMQTGRRTDEYPISNTQYSIFYIGYSILKKGASWNSCCTSSSPPACCYSSPIG